MTNYVCSSRCAHCAYLCGPDWPNDYIDDAALDRALAALLRGGCRSIHIGGGEPFLRPKRLLEVISRCRRAGVVIEYVETNAGWFLDSSADHELLDRLRSSGLSTLLVSISPFHNEHVPWKRTRGLIDSCRGHGISVFPWIGEFISDIEAFDPNTTHSLDEYEETHGPGYVAGIPRRYWISSRGRAVTTYSTLLPAVATSAILSENGPCRELLDTSHFHIDLYGNYVAGVCTGIALDTDDVPGPVNPAKYPVFSKLVERGIGDLLDWATAHGFRPREAYSGKCELCYEVRRHLIGRAACRSRDLSPRELYARE